MKEVRTLATLVLLLALATSLWAEGAREAAVPAPVTITFVLKNTTQTAPYEQIFAQYKAKTGNSVEIQALPAGEEYGQLMMTRFATNDYPDAFEMDPGTKQYIKFRAADTLFEWTGDPIMDRVTDSTRDSQALDGRIYGVPWGSTGNLGVHYNRDVFRALGVGVPQTYAQFLEICKKAKAAGLIPVYEAVKTGWPAQIFSLDGWTTHVDPAIGDSAVSRLETNQLRLNAIPAFKQVLQRQVELKTLGYYQENLLAGTYEEQQELFGTGKVAMIFQGAWVLTQLQQKFGDGFVRDKVGWFAIPGENGPGIATLYPAGQLLVPRAKKNVGISTDLVRFMTEKPSLEVWYTANPGLPVYKEGKAVLFPAQEEVLAMVQAGRAKVNVQNRLSSSFTDYPKILQQLFTDGNVDAALNLLDDNYRKTGKARQLPGF